MKKIIYLLSMLLIMSGCATWESPAAVYQRDQHNLLRQEIETKKADYNKRLDEIEYFYANGKLSESEYLTLKNDLRREWSDYSMAVQQRTDFISEQTYRLMRTRRY